MPLQTRDTASSEEGETETAPSRYAPHDMTDSPSCNDVPVLRRAAMDYLARREHSFFELSQKLQKKFPDSETEQLLDVIRALRTENLQSDDRFTESYTRYRVSRGFAYLHIRADLSSRRVSEATIEKYLSVNDTQWQQMADELAAKKLRGVQSLSYESKVHKRVLRFLKSRGFTPLQCKKALEKYLD